MRREKLNVVTPALDAAERGRYVLDDQVGFLLRIAMQRHTSIFTTRMIEGADSDPVCRAGQALRSRTLAAFSEDEQRAVVKMLRKLG